MNFRRVLVASIFTALTLPGAAQTRGDVDLPSSKVISAPAPGSPQRTNSLPVTAALSPDGKYLALLNSGFGSVESDYRQSIAIVDTVIGQVRDFPDPRLGHGAKQSYFVGLVWNSAGTELYASIGSLTDPEGKKPDNTGNGIAVYRFANGSLTADRFLKLPLVQVSDNRRNIYGAKYVFAGQSISYPAGIAFVKRSGAEALLIAENLADDAVLIDARDGHVLHRFPLGRGKVVPNSFPYTVVVNREGTRAWCSLWNGSAVAELDLSKGEVIHTIDLLPPKVETDSSSHPTALLLNHDESRLYVTVANRDKIAIILTATGKIDRYLDARLFGQTYGGNYPIALAMSGDGKSLYVADSSYD